MASNEEYQNCIAFAQWAEIQAKITPELQELTHFPAGEHRNVVTGARLKKMGLKKGFPDYLLLVPRGHFCGMVIEFKSKIGKLSKEQLWWKARLEQRGYAYLVCRSWEEARDWALEYLSLSEKHINIVKTL